MNLKQKLLQVLPTNKFEGLEELLTETGDSANGDYCLPCFSLAKLYKKSPMLIAEEIKQNLKNSTFIEKTEVVAGYLNFYLKKEEVSKEIIEEILTNNKNCFTSNVGKGKTICIDYSSVNLAKYMHIGHLKNTIIGESLARICESQGYKVVRINYIGDYGTPFGKMIVAYQKWGTKEEVDHRGIDALQDLYVKFNQEAEKDESLDDLAREVFKKIEQKDIVIYPIYKWFIEIGKKEAERLLNILGVKFDSWKGEASYADQLDDVVKLLTDKGLTKISQGALVVDLDMFDMPPCIIRRTDGASLYATRDISAMYDRFENYKFDKMFYVTGHEQMLHFKQIFKVAELAKAPFANNLEHIHYGLFSLPSGRISSRKGKQATLVDLINLAQEKANEVIKERTFNLEKPEEVATKVAKAALNFNAIKVEINKDCIFDIDKAFSFEGETAPYMQYSYTRIESILRKATDLTEENADYSVLNDDCFELVKYCNKTKEQISLAFNKREPSIIVKHCMDICKILNKFYASTKVLEGNSQEINAKLNLLKMVKITLKYLFNIMCIDSLVEM